MCALREEAPLAAEKLERLAGILNQIADGDRAIDPSNDPVLCNMIAGLAENARRVRELIPGMEQPTQVEIPEYLPFNRKERFFTGTVLPGIVAGDVLAHLHHFLELCDLPHVVPHDIAQRMNEVQFLTEYGFAESAAYDTTGRWDDYSGGRDTPDVVIAGPDWLLAIEAKMYSVPSREELERQMERQQEMVTFWAGKLGVPGHRARLVALIAEQHRDEIGGLRWPMVTWEQVAARYRGLGSPYWLHVLDRALEVWPDLRSRHSGAPSGSNGDARMTGQEISDGYHGGDLPYGFVGRDRGRTGEPFRSDVESGEWRTRRYEVRYDPLPGNPNWFAIPDFVEDCSG